MNGTKERGNNELRIKYRAWIKKGCESKMGEVTSINLDEGYINYIVCNEQNEIEIIGLAYLDEYILLQYTGLKDKNSKEIYEGDILRYSFPYDRRLRHISPVSYLDTQASFGIVDFYGNNIPLYDIPANNYFEVVGNIYENEELLKSEEKK